MRNAMTAGKFLLISASLLSVLDITALGSICQCNDQYGSIYTSLPVKTQYKNVQDYSASLSGHSGIGLSEYATQQTSERGYERLQLYKSENNQEYSYKKHLELTQPQYKNLLEVQGNNKQPYAQPVYSVQPLSLQYKKVQQTPNIQYAKYTEGLESGNKELEYLLKSNEQNNYQVKDDKKEYKTEQENTKYAVSSPIYVEKKITPSYDNKNQEQDKYIPRTSHGQGNEYEGYSHGDEGHKDYHHDKNIYYKFEYAVNDKKSHDIKHQKEERKGDKVEGVYSLVEDGGNVRTVKYVADWKNGFRAENGDIDSMVIIIDDVLQQDGRMTSRASSSITGFKVLKVVNAYVSSGLKMANEIKNYFKQFYVSHQSDRHPYPILALSRFTAG